jgi:hypothetical protein
MHETPVSDRAPHSIGWLRRLVNVYSSSAWSLRGRVNQLHEKVDRLTETLDRMVAAQKQDEKWRAVFRRQLNAVIRHLYLSDADVPSPYGLAGRRFRLRGAP